MVLATTKLDWNYWNVNNNNSDPAFRVHVGIRFRTRYETELGNAERKETAEDQTCCCRAAK